MAPANDQNVLFDQGPCVVEEAHTGTSSKETRSIATYLIQKWESDISQLCSLLFALHSPRVDDPDLIGNAILRYLTVRQCNDRGTI